MKKTILSFLLITTTTIAQTGLVTRKAMVVSAREEASKIGSDIMKQGGNAFDAMIATELALAVAYPYAGNIGGGGFMVYREANGNTGSLDYREKAPIAASKNMYLDKDGNVIPGKSTETAFAVGIPGTIAGMFEVHKKFGSLPMANILKPVIALAEQGVVVTEYQLKQINDHKQTIIRLNGSQNMYAKVYKVGDIIKYPALAQTLKQISKNGRDEFYKGETAKKLVAYLQQKGGIITLEDFIKYEAVWRKPVTFKYKDLQITSMAPPSSGGICLAQILQMIEPYEVAKLGHNSTPYIQVLTEAERRSYADRNFFLGDPDFVKIPQQQLLNTDYLKQRMADFSFEKATKSAGVGHGKITFSESNETTHYSIVDAKGNAIAATTTLNGAFGSKLYCDELGFFLNNEMDDFSSKPGTANSYGLVGAEANAIAPGKRMLSSMTPTIVEKNGKLLMVLGTPGGSTIITSVLQTILNVSEFNMTMQDAVDAPRFHHQWLPDDVSFEPAKFPESVMKELQHKGYKINEKNWPIIGKVDAIMVWPDGKREAGADHRGDDKAYGF